MGTHASRLLEKPLAVVWGEVAMRELAGSVLSSIIVVARLKWQVGDGTVTATEVYM